MPGGKSSTPVKDADASIFKTPSKGSDKRSEPKLPENMHTIRQSLAQHMMRINDKEAYNRYPAFKELVDDIFSKERGSRLSAGSAKAIKHTYDLNYTQNEKTFFAALRHMIIKSNRSVLSNKHDLEGLEKWMIKSFEDDGVMIIEDCRLVTKHIPNKTYSKSDQDKGMTEPVPDVAFGSQEPRFPKPGPQPGEYLKSLKNVAPGMDWAFLAMEHKSAAEGIVLAENQAIRDGAVLVNSQLKLNTILADPKESRPVGADKNAFAFSCAWVPDMARIFVHWVETTEEGYTIFHMNQIFEFMMTREQEMGDMRAACHTIIDWGLSTFKTAKEETFGKILAQGKGNAKSATRSIVEGALSLEDFKG